MFRNQILPLTSCKRIIPPEDVWWRQWGRPTISSTTRVKRTKWREAEVFVLARTLLAAWPAPRIVEAMKQANGRKGGVKQPSMLTHRHDSVAMKHQLYWQEAITTLEPLIQVYKPPRYFNLCSCRLEHEASLSSAPSNHGRFHLEQHRFLNVSEWCYLT